MDLPPQIEYWLTKANHDCFFTVGPENGPTERIGAIKHILLAYSEPLRSLWEDTKLIEQKDIRLNNVDPKTIRNFLTCLYGASDSLIPNFSFEECAKLLYVIEKYSVYELKSKVVDRLTHLMGPENIFIALSHPACFQAGNLPTEIMKIFRNDMDKIISDKRFLTLSDITIMWIIQQELMNVREMKIWNAISEWAKNKVKSSGGKVIRSQIFSLLKNVHSSTKEILQFSKDVSGIDAGVLLKENVIETYKSFGDPPKTKKECRNHENHQHIATCDKISSGCMTNLKEAVIICSINNIKELSEINYTEWFDCYGYSWCVGVGRKTEGFDVHLCCYLYCKSQKTNWSCTVSFDFILLNQHSGSNYTKSLQKTFDKNSIWGLSSFYNWSSLLHPYHGFVKDDCVIVMVRFKV